MAALIPRLTVALVVRFRFDGYLYGDDQAYLASFRRYAESGSSAGVEFWGTVPSFSRPLGLLHRFVVDDPLISLVTTAFVGSIAAVLIAFATGRLMPTKYAVMAGLAVALWPSQIFWSSLVLRDAYIWLATSSILAALTLTGRQPVAVRRHQVLMVVGVLAGLLYLAGNRRHSALAMTIALTLVVMLSIRRKALIPAIGLVLGLGAWTLGYGFFGSNLVSRGSTIISEGRAREVSLAETPIDCWTLPFVGAGDESGSGWSNDLRCLPTGVTAYLLMPTPAQVIDNPDLLPPLVEVLLWIPLYGLAIVGGRNAWRASVVGRLAIVYVVSTSVMWGLIDRAVGTAFRHRGEILGALVVVGCYGLSAKATSSAARARRGAA